MAEFEKRLCKSLITEHYGEQVWVVADALIAGRVTLSGLRKRVGDALNPSELKNSILVLLQHHFAVVEEYKQPTDEVATLLYKIVLDRILLIPRIPKMIFLARKRFGEIGEFLMEHMFVNGMTRQSTMLEDVTKALQEATPEHRNTTVKQVEKVFDKLISGSFVIQTKAIDEQSGNNKRKAGETFDPYWQPHFHQFLRLSRNEWIINFATSKVDKTAGDIVSVFLEKSLHEGMLGDQVVQLKKSDIKYSLPKANKVSEYLYVLEQDCCDLVEKVNDVSDAIYQLNVEKAVQLAKQQMIEKIIEDKMGPKCSRLFRLLVIMKYLEQKQLSQKAMIAGFKETKIYLNKMLQAKLVSVQEVPKTADRQPSHCHYLWTTDVDAVATELLHESYKSLVNLRERRQMEKAAHKRLLNKPRISDNDSADQIQKDDAAKRDQGEKVDRTLKQLETAEMQVDAQIMQLRDF